MIINNTEELKQYVSVAKSFVFDEFKPYVNKAISTYVCKYVGNLHKELESIAETDKDVVIKKEALSYLASAVANFGMFIYFPLLQIQLDSSGASVPQNENRKSPEWWQIKDARRELLRSGHEAMDLLLAFLEKNPAVFIDYTKNYSSINNELLVNNAAVFSKYYSIFDSRQTFLALMPILRVVEDQYISTMLCSELVDLLRRDVSGNLSLLKICLQKAIVAFAVAKVCNNGLFLLDDRGLRLDFENFGDGRKEAIQTGKPTAQVNGLADSQIDNGTQYLISAREIVTKNLVDFTQCEHPLKNSENKGSGFVPYNTRGVFGL